MIEVREIQAGDTLEAAAALLELRPRWETPAAIVEFVDDSLRHGLRISAHHFEREI
ncbi:MAG TPA: hypothetical protein VHB53_01450 [Solirubrobacterales bacterium]|nr:hypothetical protein [Solirubrobacterales bacterium]